MKLSVNKYLIAFLLFLLGTTSYFLFSQVKTENFGVQANGLQVIRIADENHSKDNSVKVVQIETQPESAIVNDNKNILTKLGELNQSTEIKLLFAGDMMLDRYIRQIADKNGGYDYIFAPLTDLFVDQDLVIVNLEGPITENKSISAGSEIGSSKNYIFTFDPSVVQTIYDNNIRLVNLGNNHILNFGKQGLESTKKILADGGIGYFGNVGENDFISTMEINNKKLAFINYNQFVKNNLAEILENIQNLKINNNYVFVYAHWGNEYSQSSTNQQNLAHQFIEAGADAVIGSHPHVVQKSEIYNGKKIYYSLGNFIFDQYFSADTQKGLLVELTIKDDQFNFKDLPIVLLPNGQTKLVD